MIFSEKLKELRKQNNLTQEELAKKLFVTRNAISKWETGKGYPNIDSLKLLSQVFKISVDELINNEDLKLIALDNNEKLTNNRNIIMSLIVFLLYTTIGTLMPSMLFEYDAGTGMVYFLLLAPIGYIIVGLIAGFISENKVYTLISGGLAIIPTYCFFDLFTNISLGLWEFLYLGVFALVYLLIRFLINLKLTKKIMTRLIIILTTIFILKVLSYIILSIIGIISVLSPVNSSPWYTPVIIYTLIFIIPILGEGLLILNLIKKRKKLN